MRPDVTSFRSRVLKGFLWLGTGSFLGQVMSWFSTIIVIRLLSPSDYGLMAMTAGFTTVLLMIGEMGVGAALVQSKELQEREIRQISAWVLLTGLIGGALCYASAPWVAAFYAEPELVPIIQTLSVTLVLAASYLVPRLLFIREMNFKVTSQIEISAQLGTTVLTLILAMKGMGVWALVTGQIATYLIKAIAFNLVRPTRYVPLFNFRGLWGLLRFGMAVTCERFLYAIYNEADNVAVGRFLGDSLLGIYAVSKTLAIIPEKAIPVITQVSFASYARIQHDLERIQRNVLRATRIVALASFPICFGMCAVAPVGVPFVLGPKWEPVVLPFQLLCLILPLRVVRSVLPPPVAAMGFPGVNLINMAITAIVMASAFVVGAWNGITGVCIAWLVAYPVVFAITTFRSLRVLKLKPNAYLSEIRFPFLGSALMLSSVWMLGKIVLTLGPFYSLALQVMFGLFIYMMLLLLFKNDEVTEIRSLLRS